jgi:hypothetical protein
MVNRIFELTKAIFTKPIATIPVFSKLDETKSCSAIMRIILST